jgi:hypothetical protein
VRVHYKDTSDEEETPPDTRESYVPVWSVFLLVAMHNCLSDFNYRRGFRHGQQTWEVAEILLKYGGYGNSFFLLTHSEDRAGSVYVISLQELIRQVKPRNQEALLQLIDKDQPSSFRSRFKKWRNTRQKKSEPSFDPAQYKPFDLSMWQDSLHTYDLYSVWSGGCETKAQDLSVRIC